MLVLCVKETWASNFPFFIYKIPEEQLDPRSPSQYRITIDQERLRKPGSPE
jgi:hypothetical protein